MSPKRVCAPPQRRSGIRVRAVGVNKEVRKSVIRFLRWLRCEMSFPIRVPVYLSPKDRTVLKSRIKVRATFFAPGDRNQEPLSTRSNLMFRRARNSSLSAMVREETVQGKRSRKLRDRNSQRLRRSCFHPKRNMKQQASQEIHL